MKKIQISLREDQLTNVELIAKLSDKSVAWVFRMILDRYEDELVKAVKKLERRGGFTVSHGVTIQNDYGSVIWDTEDEKAFLRLWMMADALQMTLEEFVHMLRTSDRECPKCREGVH